MKKQLAIFAILIANSIALAELVYANPLPTNPPPNNLNLPPETVSRLPDGSLFVPKAVQRQLALRTSVAAVGQFASVVEMNGQIIPDPNAGGRVQTTQSGRILAGATAGLAVLGQSVKQGEILAWLQPASTALEQSAQRASIAELRAQEEQLAKRVERLHLLAESVARKEVEQAEIELRAFRERKQAMQKGLQAEALRAPVSGVVSAVNVVVGQVVEAREIVFEVLDPQRLAVEAQFFPTLAATTSATTAATTTAPNFQTATAVLGNGLNNNLSLPLRFVGVGRSLKAQAMPALFRIQASSSTTLPLLAVGQTLKVLAAGNDKQVGIAVPSQAVVRDANNETIVWLHSEAERFTPRKVQASPLDGQRVLISLGLQGGERVLSQGAAALAQFR